MTKQELNNWKKQFKIGDRVSVNKDVEVRIYGRTFSLKNIDGIVESKTSYVNVRFPESLSWGDSFVVGFRTGLEVITTYKQYLEEINYNPKSKTV